MRISHKLWQIELTLLFPINRKSIIGFRMLYLRLTLTHSKGQSQVSCKFWLWISYKRWQTGQELLLLLLIHTKSPIGFRFVYLHLTLAHCKCQGQSRSQFDCEKFDKTESFCISLYVVRSLLFNSFCIYFNFQISNLLLLKCLAAIIIL